MVQHFIPHPLSAEAAVDENVVGSDDDLPRRLAREEASQQVGHVAEQPFGQEKGAEPGGGFELVVLVDLWELGEKPCYDATGAEKGGQKGEVRGYAGMKGGGQAVEEVVGRFAVGGYRGLGYVQRR